jgi:hypothetical protein
MYLICTQLSFLLTCNSPLVTVASNRHSFFFWVPEMSFYLNHSNFKPPKSQQLHSNVIVSLHMLELKDMTHQTQNQCYFTTEGLLANLPGDRPPSRAPDQFYFRFRQLLACCYGEPSVTRGQVCNLQLLLGLALAAPLVYAVRGTHGQNLLFSFCDSPIWT